MGHDLGAERCAYWRDDFFWRNFTFEGGGLDVGKEKAVIYEIIRSGGAAYEAYVMGFSGGKRVAIFPENVEFSVNFP
jgi:hypothetical protein